ncbi:MAG: sigma-70 family RNA polymerase sigma factor [Vicinamibacterales bacterium]
MTLRDVTILDARTRAATDAGAASVELLMDGDAFRGFYDRTSRALWAYLQRMTGDAGAADDLLQEAYYRFLRADVAVESETHARRYLFRVATNLARDRYRRSRVRPVTAPGEEADRAPDPAEAGQAGVDRRLDLTRAMDQLRPRDRAMLWLAYAQGASHREIASVVGVGTASVKPLLFRARRRLSALLSREEAPR